MLDLHIDYAFFLERVNDALRCPNSDAVDGYFVPNLIIQSLWCQFDPCLGGEERGCGCLR